MKQIAILALGFLIGGHVSAGPISKRFEKAVPLMLNGKNLINTSSDSKNEVQVTLGDIDSDGDLDLIMFEGFVDASYAKGRIGKFCLITNEGTKDSYLFKKREWYSFTTPSTQWCPKARGLQVADINNDNKLDLLYSDAFKNTLYRAGDGKGGFGEEILLKKFTFQASSAFCDNDGDGDLDLYYMEQNGNIEGTWHTFLNNGKNTGTKTNPVLSQFAEIHNQNGEQINFKGSSGNPTALDIDKDNDCDLFIGTPKGLFFLENNGNSQFSLSDTIETYASLSTSSQCTFGDLNNDGAIDLVYVHSAFKTSNVYIRWGIPNAVKTINKSINNSQSSFKLTIKKGEILLKDNTQNAEIIGIYDMLGRNIISFEQGTSKVAYKQLSVSNKSVIVLIRDYKGNIFTRVMNLL